MDFLSVLKEIGLKDNEAKVYISLVKLSKVTATKLSKESKIERTLTYKILEELIEKGLATYSIENKKRYFTASDPEKILIDLKEKEHKLKELIPELKRISETPKEKEIKIEIYRGKVGIKNMINEIIMLKQDYIAIGGVMSFSNVFPYFDKYFFKKLKKLGIRERIIISEDDVTPTTKNSIVSTIRYLPSKYPLPATFGVIENKIGMIIWSEPFLGIGIENEDLAKTFKSYFEALWRIAKKL
jgi:sugar-specific transcriptional regulator TrmB